MIIEVSYSDQVDKTSPVQESWTYFYVKGEDLEKAKKKAKTYWNKFIKELGWTTKAKIIHIQEIRHATKTQAPNFVVVSSSELPGRRSSSRSPLESWASSPSPRKARTRSSPKGKKA